MQRLSFQVRDYIALIAGVVLVAIQLVLTNLSVAAGISYLGRQLTRLQIMTKPAAGGTSAKDSRDLDIVTVVACSSLVY